MSNRLIKETSPYLLQHAENPVEWYPWCEEAFKRAKEDDKPIFLSIGYSTCHWCHVMAHESFEDEEIAKLLNMYFISIKVDKEERPDIDSIYMAVCQAFTGSGGWPTSIFMTADQKPFFAGTYFPKDGHGGMLGLRELLIAVHENWENNRSVLLEEAENIVSSLRNERANGGADPSLPDTAIAFYERIFDSRYGGFGRAPKFPVPHNILFLLSYYQRYGNKICLDMSERTLLQMYRGGLFDHIGFGFCRYSTDKQFLVPHFEKMLYDNALLILAYCKAYTCTQKTKLYLEIAEKTAAYILREMTSPEGGFYSAQDADSEGEEGKYYLFLPDEIIDLLGEKDGEAFNRHFGITPSGNFEGKNIPNLLNSDPLDRSFERYLPQIDSYRKKRYFLHPDDKILTSWNGLMIAAMCELYRVSGKERYLNAAVKADSFIQSHLCEGDTLFVSFRDGKRGVKGFLDDYAAYIFARLSLYGATLNEDYLESAKHLCEKAIDSFSDRLNGGFYLYGEDSEALIYRPKETYDGAIPSGNSLMAYDLVRLWNITSDTALKDLAERQLDFIASDASDYPPGFSMYLCAILEYFEPSMKITVVAANDLDIKRLPLEIPSDAAVILLREATEDYPLKDGKTTFYVCRKHSCLPPINDINELIDK